MDIGEKYQKREEVILNQNENSLSPKSKLSPKSPKWAPFRMDGSWRAEKIEAKVQGCENYSLREKEPKLGIWRKISLK